MSQSSFSLPAFEAQNQVDAALNAGEPIPKLQPGRCNVTAFVDDSYSMNGVANTADGGEGVSRKQEASQAIDKILDHIRSDAKLKKDIAFAELRFADRLDFNGYHHVDAFQRSNVDLGMGTHMNEALMLGKEKIHERMQEVMNTEGDHNPGIFFLITDGKSSDGNIEKAVDMYRDMEQRRLGFLYGIGFSKEDAQNLRDGGFPENRVYCLESVPWSDIICVLRQSIKSVSVGQIPRNVTQKV